MLFFGDGFTEDSVNQCPGGSGNINGLVNGGMIRDTHFVELINSQSQNLASRQVESGRPEPLNDEIEIRSVPDDAVECFGNERSVDIIQPRSLQRLMKNLVSKFSTGLPTLKRL